MRRGFTVIELVGVLAIMGILLASVVGAFLGWGQAGAVDGASDMVQSALSHARELAITRRETTGLVCGNGYAPNRSRAGRGFFVLVLVTRSNDAPDEVAADLSPTNYLPGDVQFGNAFTGERKPVIVFTSDGRARLPTDTPSDPDDFRFVVYSARGGRVQRAVTVDPLTGIARVEQR